MSNNISYYANNSWITIVIIFIFISTILVFPPRSSLHSRNFPSVFLLASLFFASTIQYSSIPSLFTMHRLCNTMHVAIIFGIFMKDISDHFIINLRLSFKIPKACSTHILIEDWMKFQFISFPNNALFPPLNGQYI